MSKRERLFGSLRRRAIPWVGAAVLLAGAAAALRPATAQPSPKSANGIVGAWIISTGEANHAGLHTFNRDGTMAVVVSPPPAKGGQGAWIKVGEREFLSTFLVVINTPMGKVITKKHSQHITLADDGNSFTAVVGVEICDDAGANCFSAGCEHHNGTRIQVEDISCQ